MATLADQLRVSAHGTEDPHAAAALFRAAKEIEALAREREEASARWMRICSSVASGKPMPKGETWAAE